MAPSKVGYAPNLAVFLRSLRDKPLEASIEYLISLLKRRQIKGSSACAIATAQLLLRVVARFKWTDVDTLIDRIRDVGRRLREAQPREMVVGNVILRILGMIREEAKEDRNEDTSETNSNVASPRPERNISTPEESYNISTTRPSLLTSHTSYAVVNGAPVQKSMFNLLSESRVVPSIGKPQTNDLKAEIISGIEEIIDEITQVHEQISSYALDFIHSNEVILIQGSSRTVQSFLLKAASKRKFTVIQAESFPNHHQHTYRTIMGKVADDQEDDELDSLAFQKPLTALGIKVILITDSQIFGIMSRVNKCILGTSAVIANGGLLAPAGSRLVAKSAKRHTVPVIILSGIYKLSPETAFDIDSLIEYGDTSAVIPYDDGDLVDKLEVDNPLFDYVPPELVDLYITNLGAHAPSYLYRIVADHYKPEDINFHNPELQI